MGLYVPGTPQACSLLDLSVLLRDTLICKESKHPQKDGKDKEAVITGWLFSPRSDGLQGPPKSRLASEQWGGLSVQAYKTFQNHGSACKSYSQGLLSPMMPGEETVNTKKITVSPKDRTVSNKDASCAQ